MADANDVTEYLNKELIVPRENINVLQNSQATRAGIIGAIQALGENPLIKEQDPIVIYFAGHGCTLKGPAGWAVGETHIQGIVTYDTNMKAPNGELISAIPDYTINALLGRLASVKGDNIVRLAFIIHLVNILTSISTRQSFLTAVTLEVGLDMTRNPISLCDPSIPRTFHHSL